MREIKFRLWDKESFKMHYQRNSWDAWCFDDEYDSIHFPLKVDGFMGYRDHHKAELMQYTGLKDKNDKDIYEGDLIDTNGGVGVVVWEPLKGLWGVRITNHELVWVDPLFNWYDATIVLGNIYENHELLEGTK